MATFSIVVRDWMEKTGGILLMISQYNSPFNQEQLIRPSVTWFLPFLLPLPLCPFYNNICIDLSKGTDPAHRFRHSRPSTKTTSGARARAGVRTLPGFFYYYDFYRLYSSDNQVDTRISFPDTVRGLGCSWMLWTVSYSEYFSAKRESARPLWNTIGVPDKNNKAGHQTIYTTTRRIKKKTIESYLLETYTSPCVMSTTSWIE